MATIARRATHVWNRLVRLNIGLALLVAVAAPPTFAQSTPPSGGIDSDLAQPNGGNAPPPPETTPPPPPTDAPYPAAPPQCQRPTDGDRPNPLDVWPPNRA